MRAWKKTLERPRERFRERLGGEGGELGEL